MRLLDEFTHRVQETRGWTTVDGAVIEGQTESHPVAWDDLTAIQKHVALLYEVTTHLKYGAYALYSGAAIQATKDGLEDPDIRYAVES